MHSQIITKSYKNLSVTVLPALSDNYMYAVVDQSNNHAVIIDPSDAKNVQTFLSNNPEIQIKAILATHHHWDHVGGITELADQFSVPVYGGDDRVDSLTNKQTSGNIQITNNLNFQVFFTPCHTTGHICFYNSDNGIIFTGDTLFLTGAGRFFEGDGQQMTKNFELFRSLPAETEIYCGHEYNLGGLKFARALEPENADITTYETQVNELRATKPPTPSVPGTIAQELKTNPFFRLNSSSLKSNIGCDSTEPSVIMDSLRTFKNNWKPSA